MKNKPTRKQILASGLILFPILVALVFPEPLKIAFGSHWGHSSNLPLLFFLLPVVFLGAYWLCLWGISRDAKNDGRNEKVQSLIFWMVPLMSNGIAAMFYAIALRVPFSAVSFMMCAIGLLFLAIGNYLPKCRQNATIGLRTPWALQSEVNWNATHKVGGRVWIVGGLVMMLSVLLPRPVGLWIWLGTVIVMVAIPFGYSYWKARRDGETVSSGSSRSAKQSPLFVVATLVLVGVLLFTGNIEVVFHQQDFTVHATYYSDLTVSYDQIDSVEYVPSGYESSRSMGFGTPRLLMGTFENTQYGFHTRYTYAGCEACVILTSGDRVLVINGKTPEQTQEIYDTLLQHIPS